MTKEMAKEILGFLVPLCSIVNCLLAVYGVFHVVDFVVDVKPMWCLLPTRLRRGDWMRGKSFRVVA